MGIAGLLIALLPGSPWSPSTQPSGFSLTLDLDDADGDQAISSLDLLPDQPVSIQVFASDIQNAQGISVRFGYDAAQINYVGFDPGEVLPNVQVIVQQDSTSIRIGVSSLSGSATVNTGLVGTVHFRTTAVFSDTEIWLIDAELARGGQTEKISPALGVSLQVAAPPSPDFDGNGQVGFSDFLAFGDAYGSRQGDETYRVTYDLNGDGGIGFDDLLIFAESFGDAVNRAPVFVTAPPVTRSLSENTPSGQPIGDPVLATDADGDTLTYGLRGVHADRFSIGAGTGQLLTKEGITYDHEASDTYTVTVRVSDGKGGRATVGVGIHVTDVDEPPGAPPEGVAVAPRDTALTVTWTAAPDEAGKPPVGGYEVGHRPADSEEWLEGLLLESRTDTSVTIAGLTNEQTYHVRVRTLNEEGASPWSEPVVGAPTVGPRPVGVIGDQTVYVDRDLRVNLASLFTRPALGSLTYGTTSSDDAIAAVTVADTLATVRGVATGRATITATAGNTYGNSAQTTFAVVVTTPPPPPPPPGPVGPVGPFRPPPPPPSAPPPPPPPTSNTAPTFDDGASTSRTVAENTPARQPIQHPVRATDPDGHRLTYNLSGPDSASFSVDTGTGQLRTLSGITYDFEDNDRYSVDLEADDPDGGTATIGVTIHVADVDEPPSIPAAPLVQPATTTSLTVTWDAPDNTGPAINDYDVQYREGDSGGFSSWTHNSADRTATITGRTPGTSYQVQVLARSPEGTSGWSEPGSGSTDPNQLPVFTDGSGATRSLAENTTGTHDIGDPVGATDAEKTTLTYALEGAHADTFSIDTRSGQLRTRTGKTYDYEATPRFSVDVRATDGHGGDRSIPVSIDLTDVNEVPVFTGEATLEAPENQSFAGTVTAEDLDRDDAISDYTITGGSDRDLLEINSTGALTFKDDPDFETPTDAGRNNGYVVEVTVTGGSGGRALTAEQAITVNVTDENEPPRFTSVDTFTVVENVLLAGRLAAQEVDRDDGITGYDVTGGDDSDDFEIKNTRELHFKDKPDFERPVDARGNNEYIVAVEVTGGADTRELAATQSITVTVEDDVEPPGRPDPPTVSDETENSLTMIWIEPANPGPDIDDYDVRYRKDGNFLSWPHDQTGTTATITELEVNTRYEMQVQAHNPEGWSEWSVSRFGTTCSGGGFHPTPDEVEVSAVPIVVESTTADYFVLYVRFDVDGTVLELPVSVTLGASGTTTLSENVEALRAERYRVEKYLIADPADVDGDCIDDVTELADPVGMNPVNPAPAIEFSDGAVVVPDRDTFDRLAPTISFKFILFGINSARPGIYFINTETHGYHQSFLDIVDFERETVFVGRISYRQELIAPDGSMGVFVLSVGRAGLPFSNMDRIHTLVAASMPLLDDNLALYIANRSLPSVQSNLPLFRDSRINLLFEGDIYGETSFLALNQTEGYGRLRVVESDERPHPRDIALYEALPNNIPRVAGIISTVPQTPLSHVNLRAVQDGIPNAFIRDALDKPDINTLVGGYVYFKVTETGYTIRAATRAEVDAHYESSRPAQAQTPQRDLSVTEIKPLSEIGFDDWDTFGVKAANVAVLRTLGFPDGTVPDGFAIPFYFYDEFMKHNDFYTRIGTMLANEEFQTDFTVQEDSLKTLRKAIEDAPTPDWIIAAIEKMNESFDDDINRRYRSSTNNEDLPGFNGAGLYDSKSQKPSEDEEDVAKSLKEVYASLWNFRAFAERDFHRIDHLTAAMGILVHPSYQDELVNGVAVSFDPFGGVDGTYYVNSQAEENLVTNPDPHSVPEELMLYPSGSYFVLATSNLVESGQLLMTDAQVNELRLHLEVIHNKFNELYNPASDEPFAMEIEFKITSENILAIKQARPWVFGAP